MANVTTDRNLLLGLLALQNGLISQVELVAAFQALTGRPPVEGDLGDVIRAVQRGEIPSPRGHDATIDAALEAVCLKAMANRPDDRYPLPKALAEDIDRWMADEPVSAWREPIPRRLRRWGNWNRTAVASLAVALVAGVLGLSVVLGVQTRAKAEVTRALAGERDANKALAGFRRTESLLAATAGNDPEARSALASCRTRMASLLSTMSYMKSVATCRSGGGTVKASEATGRWLDELA